MCNTIIYLPTKELFNKEKGKSLFSGFQSLYNRLRKFSLEHNLTGSWHRSIVEAFAIKIIKTVLSLRENKIEIYKPLKQSFIEWLSKGQRVSLALWAKKLHFWFRH